MLNRAIEVFRDVNLEKARELKMSPCFSPWILKLPILKILSGLWNKKNRTDQKPVLPNDGKFFLLRAGDKYNLRNREVIHWTGTNRGISRDKDVK